MTPAELDVTVILCTRNRGQALRPTADRLCELMAASPLRAELLFVDSASTDDTRAVMDEYAERFPFVRAVASPKGRSAALNVGMDNARGEALLFTDDDVIHPEEYLEEMSRPLLDGSASGVAGGVRINESLLRPWMEPIHREMLASTESHDREDPHVMVGANMGIARSVRDRIPYYDEELGHGSATGLTGEELLFSMQMRAAGLKIAGRHHVEVDHRFNPDRLTVDAFVRYAQTIGATHAYLRHHWSHTPYAKQLLQYWAGLARRTQFRAPVHQAGDFSTDGIPAWEIQAYRLRSLAQAMAKLKDTPRKYAREGLRKIGG